VKTAKDQLRHLAAYLDEPQAEQLLAAAAQLGLLAPLPCPSCGEFNFDRLEWTDEDLLVCLTCATTFDPNGPGPLKHERNPRS